MNQYISSRLIASILPSTGGNDVLVGEETADTISGLAGDDSINGNGGNDLVFGNAGMDRIFGGAGQNTLFGGAGADVINGDDEEPFSGIQGGNDLIYGGRGGDLLIGGMGDDTVYGCAGNDTLQSYGGNDHAYGGRGDDMLFAGTGILSGGAGNDTLQGQDARGGFGQDSLTGDTLSSHLQGGGGADTIRALSGFDDTLTGGRGADLFVFLAQDRGTDTVTDFDARRDGLDFAELGVTTDQILSHAAEQGGDLVITVDTGTGVLTVVLQGVGLGDF